MNIIRIRNVLRLRGHCSVSHSRSWAPHDIIALNQKEAHLNEKRISVERVNAHIVCLVSPATVYNLYSCTYLRNVDISFGEQSTFYHTQTRSLA